MQMTCLAFAASQSFRTDLLMIRRCVKFRQMEVTNERYGGTILHIFLTLISSVLNFLILVDLVGDDLAHQQTLLQLTLNKFESNIR
jgi:hypothetical protein